MHLEHDVQSLASPSDPEPELAAQAAQAIGLSLIVTDVNGLILLWNRGAEELYGWSPVEAMGVPVTALLVQPSARADAVAILAPLASGQPWSGEFELRHRTGRVFSARISAWPMRDGTGAVVGFVGLSQDASDPDDHALVRELVGVLRQLVPAAVLDQHPVDEPATFDSDAAAVEIVTRALDPELRAAVDADPHGTVLPVDGLTLAELDDLLASLVALAVHTATVAAERCGSRPEHIVASAALRLRGQ
jgi:PAS domain S-box-containing protein